MMVKLIMFTEVFKKKKMLLLNGEKNHVNCHWTKNKNALFILSWKYYKMDGFGNGKFKGGE